MKKIINNKLYNTDTANSLIYWYNDLPSMMVIIMQKNSISKRLASIFCMARVELFLPMAAMIARADVLTLTGTSFH